MFAYVVLLYYFVETVEICAYARECGLPCVEKRLERVEEGGVCEDALHAELSVLAPQRFCVFGLYVIVIRG